MEAININAFNNKKIKESDVIKRIINREKELFEILLLQMLKCDRLTQKQCLKKTFYTYNLVLN